MRTTASQNEQELITQILEFKYDPLGFVNYVFPWGQPNTPLQALKEPRGWQIEDWEYITDRLQENKFRSSIGLTPQTIYMARASGRGPGKSAWLAMTNMWMMSCWIGGTSIITANTEAQLRSRTMAELGKWHTLAINRHWFEKSSMSLRPEKWFKGLVEEQLKIDTQYYYADAQTWSEDNPDAFAGAHSQIAMMVSFDEASGIPDPIWNISEGFFTDLAELRLWTAISNPRNTSGRFYSCFHEDRAFWDTKMIDSRSVEGIDSQVYQRIVDKYGEDHDVTRVEVKGEFPKSGEDIVISRGLAEAAVEREIEEADSSRIIWGVDVARFGLDRTSLVKRQGPRVLDRVEWWRGRDTMQSAGKIHAMYNAAKFSQKPDVIVVDVIGLGAGVVDALKEKGLPVKAVNVSESPAERERFVRQRDELYWLAREWFESRTVSLPKGCEDLIGELVMPWYEYRSDAKIKVAAKQDIKKKLGRSPDFADAFVLTFAVSDRKSAYSLPERTDLARFA